jgi:hypothetical protein
MDGSEKKKEHQQLLFSVILDGLEEWWERQKMTYSKASTTIRMCIQATTSVYLFDENSNTVRTVKKHLSIITVMSC